MVEARAQWTDQERFLGIATSGHAIVIDAAKDKTANSPMELVLIGLCGCTASDVVSILRKKREPFTSLEVRAQAGFAKGGGRCRPALEREVLLGFSHAGEDRQDRSRN